MREDVQADSVKSDVLRLVAPGTPLREGLENVLRAKTGALIVLGYEDGMEELVDGGGGAPVPLRRMTKDL